MTDSPDPEYMARLERAVRNLPRLQRDIFLTHRLEGLSYREIADQTRLTVPQIQTHMARALYKLDRQMCGYRLTLWERWF